MGESGSQEFGLKQLLGVRPSPTEPALARHLLVEEDKLEECSNDKYLSTVTLRRSRSTFLPYPIFLSMSEVFSDHPIQRMSLSGDHRPYIVGKESRQCSAKKKKIASHC